MRSPGALCSPSPHGAPYLLLSPCFLSPPHQSSDMDKYSTTHEERREYLPEKESSVDHSNGPG